MAIHLRVQRGTGRIGAMCNPYGGLTTSPDMAKVTCALCVRKFEEAKALKMIDHV